MSCLPCDHGLGWAHCTCVYRCGRPACAARMRPPADPLPGELGQLTRLMGESGIKGARLGYALGYLHGKYAADPDIATDDPAFRVVSDLGLGLK